MVVRSISLLPFFRPHNASAFPITPIISTRVPHPLLSFVLDAMSSTQIHPEFYERRVVLPPGGGATRGLEMRGNGHTVGGVIVGSPADAAMVLRDDRILTVDGRSMDDMTTQEVRLR